MTGTRPLPTPTFLSAPFWSAVAEGQLRLPACLGCGCHFFPPRPACPDCRGTVIDWVLTDGAGTVYSATVVHRKPAEGFEVPFVLALVEIDPGWILMTHVVGCPPDEVAVGARVRLVADRDVPPGAPVSAVPVFTLA